VFIAGRGAIFGPATKTILEVSRCDALNDPTTDVRTYNGRYRLCNGAQNKCSQPKMKIAVKLMATKVATYV